MDNKVRMYFMNEADLNMVKIIFLLGFTVHNLEEAIWLPRWSKYAGKFHRPVEADPFIFAVMVVTMIGCILTALDVWVGDPGNIVNYLYLGFVGMMGINAILPHLAATIMLKKYAPGLMTALFLNLPLACILIAGHIQNGISVLYLLAAIVIVSALMLFSLKYLFSLGKLLINF